MEARTSIIKKRMANINHIIAVASGKGGVGKSMVASGLALNLAHQGKTVGLLDLDLYGPSTHVILGIQDVYPEEKNGILPPIIHNIHFMSIVFFTEDKPAPFRGNDITNIIIELLAITQWGSLDYLIIDLPPGLGEETLDIIRFIPNCEFLVVTTSSKVALAAVTKLLLMLNEMNHPIRGVIENMVLTSDSRIKKAVKEHNIAYLGSIPFDQYLEESLGQPTHLMKTPFMKNLQKLLPKLINASSD